MDLSDLNWEKAESGFLVYVARASRGAEYGLLHPPLLFPVVTGTLRVLPGWYTDVNGKIEKVA